MTLREAVVAHVKTVGPVSAASFYGVPEATLAGWLSDPKKVPVKAVEALCDFRTPPEATVPWEGRGKVTILLPWYKTAHPYTVFSLMQLFDKSRMRLVMEPGNSFVAHARNALAQHLLNLDTEFGFFVDDDMILPCGHAGWFKSATRIPISDARAGLHAIERLVSHNKSLVGALYYGRTARGRALYEEALSNAAEELMSRTATGVRETQGVGFGCVLVKTQVFKDIQRALPELAPMHASEPWQFFSNASDSVFSRLREFEQAAKDASTDPAKAEKLLKDVPSWVSSTVLETRTVDRLQRGEDFLFCRRAARAGHKAFVDMDLLCGHVGGAVYGPHNTNPAG